MAGPSATTLDASWRPGTVHCRSIGSMPAAATKDQFATPHKGRRRPRGFRRRGTVSVGTWWRCRLSLPTPPGCSDLLQSVIERDAAITTWAKTATAPIDGQLPMAPLEVGRVVDASGVIALGTGTAHHARRGHTRRLMTAIEIYALRQAQAMRDGQLRRFRFGIGKVEQIVNLVIGASLCRSGLWVEPSGTGRDPAQAGGASASPLDMAIAAVDQRGRPARLGRDARSRSRRSGD